MKKWNVDFQFGVAYAIKEIFKVPLDKEKKTIQYEDLIKIIESLCEGIDRERNKEVLESLRDNQLYR